MDCAILEDSPVRKKTWLREYCPRMGLDAMLIPFAKEFISFLAANKKDIKKVYLDHDLHNVNHLPKSITGSGGDVVDWLEKHSDDKELKAIEYTVHSMNTRKGDKMAKKLKEAGYNVRRIPYCILMLKVPPSSLERN
jgi:hypothetical protein